jgi:hypothetical protein
MSDETKPIDKKKLSDAERIAVLEGQVAALTTKLNQLFKNAQWERECELNRRGRF